MGKTRFGVLDLQVQARELQRRLVGARVANVYDLNSRTYILKLTVPPLRAQHKPSAPAPAAPAAPAEADGWSKVLLLIESGARVHTTDFVRDYGTVPSGFCLKLRKHVRTRRLDAVRQLGSDRMLMLSFSGGGEAVCNVIVEFYAGGNVILTAPDFSILAMLRQRRPAASGGGEGGGGGDGGGGEGAGETSAGSVVVGSRFPVEAARPAVKLARGAFDAAVSAVLERARGGGAGGGGGEEVEVLGRAARRRRAQAAEARRALAGELEIGPQLVEHALVRAGVEATAGVEVLEGEEVAGKVFEGIKEIERMVEEMPARGLLFVKDKSGGVGGGVEKDGGEAVDGKDEEDVIDDVAPFMLAQFEGRRFKEFDFFDNAVDAYFVRLEMGRAEAAKAKRAAAAYKKVDKLTSELRGQVTALESTQTASTQKAQAIESNIVEVDAAITVVSSALAAAVDWDHLARMVEEEKKNANPVAEIIHSLHLERNEITLMLEDAWGMDDEEEEDFDDGEEVEDEEDREGGGHGEDDIFSDSDDDEVRTAGDGRKGGRGGRRKLEQSAATRKALLVDVDLSLTAYANAREYYAMKKTAAMKMEKAVEATDRTIKVATRKAASDAQKMEAAAAASSIRARRKPYWFEKFHWMVSSENFLIVAGRDAQQNELLVKRYMGPNDVYVHADVHGASSVVVKNQKIPNSTESSDIPRLTMEQAGTFAMCRSKAWDDKIVTSAWWVRASQVSKTAPSGLSLGTGSFVIRGKKNFLDPNQLVMGFAFLFKIDESCVARHRGERRVRGKNNDSSSSFGGDAESGSLSIASESTVVTESGPAHGNADETACSSTWGAEGDLEASRRDADVVIIGEVSGETNARQLDGSLSENASADKAVGTESDLEDCHTMPESVDTAAESTKVVAENADVDKDSELFAKFGSLSVDSKLASDPSCVVEDEVDGEIGSQPNKYGLDTVVTTEEASGDEACRDSADGHQALATGNGSVDHRSKRASKPRMSAKERRQLKKANTGTDATEGQGRADTDEAKGNSVPKKNQASDGDGRRGKGSGAVAPPSAPIPRGKRNKLKKMKKKYGDQDDEEREIALAVLGAKKVKEHLPIQESEMTTPGGSGGNEGDSVGENDEGKELGGQGSSRTSKTDSGKEVRRREKKEVMRILDDEGILELSELEKESLTILDMLTATPFPDDVVQYALPVCAPYSALTGYRYRAKLLPGVMKRGKAYRASLGLFLRQAEKELRLHTQERDAMRLTPENDAIQAMLASVRVAAPGLKEAHKGGKQKGKGSGKK